MNIPAEQHEIGIAAVRPDGSTISADELVGYLESVRVAAGVVDGHRVGRPAVHSVRMAVTEDGLVLRSDDLPATLDWQALVRSLAHRFGTVAFVDDGVVGPTGHLHTEADLPEEWERLLEDLLEPDPSTSVHVMRIDPNIDIDAELIAGHTGAPVERAVVDGFMVVRAADETDAESMVDLTLRSQLPAVSFLRVGERTEAVLRVRAGRRTVDYLVTEPVQPTLPQSLKDPVLRDLLTEPVDVSASRRTSDEALVERLLAAGSGPTSFAHDVAVAAGIPIEAAGWLDRSLAPGPVQVVEPSTTRALLAKGARDFQADVRQEFTRESLSQGPLGGFRRFLLDHPLVTLAYGLAEVTLAYVLATAFEPWAPVRWALAGVVALDGLMSLGLGAVSLRRRRARR